MIISKNGEFEICYGKKCIGISSPIEQNQRHITLLSKLIKKYDLLPKRALISIKPNFKNYILISPETRVRRADLKKFNYASTNIIKADMLKSVIDYNAENVSTIDAFSSIKNLSSFSEIEDFGKKLVKFHRPKTIDWKKKFGIKEKSDSVHKDSNTNVNNVKSGYFCAKCKAKISYKEAKFCWSNRTRFEGKAFCYKCQKQF